MLQERVLASLGALAVGTLLGVRHAFEPDHIAAVTTLVVEAKSAWRGAILGAVWGIGHTISLVLLGTVLVATRTVLSVRAAAAGGAWGVGFRDRRATHRAIGAASRRGLATTVYTVNDTPRMLALAAAGVTGIFTDRPREALAVLRGSSGAAEE